MSLLSDTLQQICAVARVPSFSSYEDRLHPLINDILSKLPHAQQLDVEGNNLIYHCRNNSSQTVALTAHLDKINHYGSDYPDELPVRLADEYIEGAMDNSAGVGILLAIAERIDPSQYPNVLFFFSEMEESKGLREHPELLRNNGVGYEHGMGAKRISRCCIDQNIIPDPIITVDTTPLFKGDRGVAVYANHWEINDLKPSRKLQEKTKEMVDILLKIDNTVRVENNTNDYLHYGYEFNRNNKQDVQDVVSVALEPAIYPYHQKGERIYIRDIERVLSILTSYLSDEPIH